MGYEIEMSFDLRKQKNISSLLDATIELAENNNCERHFKFTECEGKVRKRRQSYVLVFCFDEERFNEMTNFLKEVIKRYKQKICIESISEIEKQNLIYASPYYMELMEKEQKEQKDEYKHRRQTRSFSETDYFILRDILKKKY